MLTTVPSFYFFHNPFYSFGGIWQRGRRSRSMPRAVRFVDRFLWHAAVAVRDAHSL